MKIALINENSQAAKNALLDALLRDLVKGHAVGCCSSATKAPAP